MEIMEVDPKTVDEVHDFVLLPRVQKTGSYRALMSKIAKQDAASFLYRPSRGVMKLALSQPRLYFFRVDNGVRRLLFSKYSKLLRGRLPSFTYHFIIARWDLLKETCVVVVWKRGYKMTLRRMHEVIKKPMRPAELE